MTAAREPLSYPEHAFWVTDDAAELAYARRDGADLPRWPWRPEGLANEIGILLEDASAEEIPLLPHANRGGNGAVGIGT